MIILTGKAGQLFDEGANFSRQASGTDSGQKFGMEDVAAQGVAAIGVRRASRGVVPRRSAAVAQRTVPAPPRPQFHQRMHPEIQMIHADVRPQVADLLLARPPDFLEVVKVLFDGCAVGKSFQDLFYRGLGIGVEEKLGAGWFLYDHHPDYAAGRSVGSQERFVFFAYRLPVLYAFHDLPATFGSGPFGQTDPFRAVLARCTAFSPCSLFGLRRQAVQTGVLAQATDDDTAPLP